MHGFVLDEVGGMPKVGEFKQPEVADEGQEIVKMLAAGMNPVERFLSQNPEPLPRVVGLEGIGERADGTRVYVGQSVTPFGTFAEQALTRTEQNIEVPTGIDNGMAIALGVAGMAAWLPLQWKAKVQPGESVLILGATGVQGQLAVQIAKLLGAGHVVAAGRDKETLESLRDKGADEIAILEDDMAQALKQAAPDGGYHVAIDCVFGEPFRALLDSQTLGANSRVVVLGGGAGQEITLGFRQLQAAKGATIAGYSSFGVPAEVKREAYLSMVQYAVDGKLSVEVKEYSLDQASEAWEAQGQSPHYKSIIVL